MVCKVCNIVYCYCIIIIIKTIDDCLLCRCIYLLGYNGLDLVKG